MKIMANYKCDLNFPGLLVLKQVENAFVLSVIEHSGCLEKIFDDEMRALDLFHHLVDEKGAIIE